MRQKLPSLKKRLKESENTLEEKEKEIEKMKRNATISKTRIEQLQSKTELQQEELSEYAIMEAVQDCDFKGLNPIYPLSLNSGKKSIF